MCSTMYKTDIFKDQDTTVSSVAHPRGQDRLIHLRGWRTLQSAQWSTTGSRLTHTFDEWTVLSAQWDTHRASTDWHTWWEAQACPEIQDCLEGKKQGKWRTIPCYQFLCFLFLARCMYPKMAGMAVWWGWHVTSMQTGRDTLPRCFSLREMSSCYNNMSHEQQILISHKSVAGSLCAWPLSLVRAPFRVYTVDF